MAEVQEEVVDPASSPTASAENMETEHLEKIALNGQAEQETYPYDREVACWSMVSLQAPAFEPTERSNIDVVTVVDKSGSMSGEKIGLVRETLHFVVDQLKDADRLGIVSYDTNVYDDLLLTKMDQKGKLHAHDVIDKLKDGSSTNLSGGLERGLQLIEMLGNDKKDVSSVLLMTDGIANQGVTNRDDILRRMTRAGRSPTGVLGGAMASMQRGVSRLFGNHQNTGNIDEVAAIVHTFGFGSDHVASLLEAISEQGGGTYYFIEDNEKIPEAFADCLGGLLSTVGQNVFLQITAKNKAQLTKVHHRRAGPLTESATKCEVKLGDIQSEEQRDIVIQVKLPQLKSPQPDPEVILEAELSYFNAITSMMEKDVTVVRVNRIGEETVVSTTPNPSIDLQRNRVIGADAMKRATELADKNDLEAARAVIDKVHCY
jgi:hypothetical protein